MKARIILIFTLMISVLLSKTASCQQTGQFVENSQLVEIPFTITNYNTKHGLPQNQVTDILTKKNGELLLSTANGIVSYDGYSFSRFIKNGSDKNTLHTKLLYSEKNKQLYGLELGSGFNQIDPKVTRLSGFTSACIYDDKIYGVHSNGNICVFDPEDRTTTTLIKTGVSGTGSMVYNGKYFYIAGEHGMFVVDRSTKKSKCITTIGISEIKENPLNGEIYFFSKTQIFKLLINQTFVQLIPEINTTDFVFHDIAFTPDDEMYIATSKGLIYSGFGYSEIYDESTFLPSENIVSLCYSKTENCIFAGTGNKGLLKLQLKNCSSLIQFKDLSNCSLSSVLISSEGKTLACASNGIVYHISVDAATPYVSVPSQPSAMMEIGEELWVGTWGQGIFRFKNQKPIGKIELPQVKNSIIHSGLKDKRGYIWVGNAKGISVGKTPESLKPILEKQIHNDIITIYEKRNGNILLGGNNGLYEIDKQHNLFKHWGETEGLKCKEIRSIYEDKAGKIWLGTYGGGLYCLENSKLTSINAMKNCMLSEDVFTIAKDFSGSIYMTSNNGLWIVNEKQLNDFYRHKLDYLIPLFYGNETGIMNTEFNGGFQNNFAHSPYDHFYFPSIEGLVIVSPVQLMFRKLKPDIKWIKINNQLIDKSRHVFERTTHTIKLNFHVANFSSKFNIYYQYQLKGPNTSNEWEEMQKSAIVNISFLPPGEYTLRFRALDANNDPNPTIVEYNFEIEPYYYETWWFRILVLVIAVSIITFIVRYRISSKRRKEIRENIMNNNMLELKLKAIQSKMNPHFVFNTLNNIQYLIASSRNEEAEHTLNEFSQLLRKFLQQSNRSFVRLNDEMDIIMNYLLVEQIRFKGDLNIEIDIKESCANRVIPTLLLQPVVENAVKHGLAHKNSDKTLRIKTECNAETLIIKVEDNGIGREASQQINQFRSAHVSHGWKLVEEKIDVIQQKYGISISYEIIDQITPETGTIVVFYIPIIDDQLLNY